MPTTMAKRLGCLELADLLLSVGQCVAEAGHAVDLDLGTTGLLGDAIGRALRDEPPLVLRQPGRLSALLVAAVRGAVERYVPADHRNALYEALAQAFEREAASRGAVVCAAE